MKRERFNNRGAALVELALIFPVMLFLIGSGIELSRASYDRATLVSLAREAGVSGFRECIGSSDVVCLTGAINNSWSVISAKFPQATARFRLVKYQERYPYGNPNIKVTWSLVSETVVGVNTPDRASQLGTIDAAGNSHEMDTYFAETHSGDLPRRDLVLKNQEYMLLAEYYYPYRPMVSFLANALGLDGKLVYVRIQY